MTKPLITILDDEPAIRTMLSEALEDAGYDTQCFARAAEFETALRRTTPDVCLVDLGLPARDGLSLVHRLALEQGATVIIISGRAQVQDRITGLELGADDLALGEGCKRGGGDGDRCVDGDDQQAEGGGQGHVERDAAGLARENGPRACAQHPCQCEKARKPEEDGGGETHGATSGASGAGS